MILYISFGAIHPRLVGTVPLNIIAVSCLFCVATFFCRVAKNFCIFNMGYSEIELLAINGIQANVSMWFNGLL